MKKFSCFIVALLMLLLCTGCSRGVLAELPEVIDRSTMIYQEDGSLLVHLVEEFDPQLYDVNELKVMAESEVNLYNDANGSDTYTPVVLQAVESMSGGRVKVSYLLNDPKLYAQFVGGTTEIMTVKDALSRSASSTFHVYDVKSKELVNADELEKIGDNQIIMTSFRGNIYCHTSVICTSKDAAVDEDGSIVISEGADVLYIILDK
jgi:hypothetical protein